MRRTRKITTEQEAAIVEQYLSGDVAAQIAPRFAISMAYIYTILKEHGVPRQYNRRKDVTDATIIAALKSGKPARQIARELNIDDGTVRNRLKRLGLSLPMLGHAPIVYSHDESVFDTITEESAYWIGFLMADGNIYRGTRYATISLHLAIQDLSHVEKFRAFVKSNAPIRIAQQSKLSFKGQPTAKFSFTDHKMCDNLATYGVTPNKTLTAQVKELEMNRHFWRGFVDGDGCVSLHKQAGRIHLGTGSRVIIEQFSSFIRAYIPEYKATVKKESDRKLWSVVVGIKAIQLLYGLCSVALDRKLERAQLALKRHSLVNSVRQTNQC